MIDYRGRRAGGRLFRKRSNQLPTAKQAALATQLLARYGVFTRSMAARELASGGYAAVYPVFKAMEEAGKARRGYFVEGLGGAQFATAGADDLLRSRDEDKPPQALVLAATDPANAYGAALPWPDRAAAAEETEGLRLQRAVGALVVLFDGDLIGYLSKSQTKLLTFLAEEEPQRTRQMNALATALAERAAFRDPLLLEQIDGAMPQSSPLAEALAAVGFELTSRGWLHTGAVNQVRAKS